LNRFLAGKANRPHHLTAVEDGRTDTTLDFDNLFDGFAPYVAAVALRLIGDPTLVDDLVQEVFFDCFRKIETLNDREHARRWLVKVTVRKASRLLRRKKILSFFRLSTPVLPDPSMPSASADDRAAVIQLFTILERLPVQSRTAWCLRYLEGAELTEVAAACGCSLATAKRRISVAHRALLGEDHG